MGTFWPVFPHITFLPSPNVSASKTAVTACETPSCPPAHDASVCVFSEVCVCGLVPSLQCLLHVIYTLSSLRGGEPAVSPIRVICLRRCSFRICVLTWPWCSYSWSAAPAFQRSPAHRNQGTRVSYNPSLTPQSRVTFHGQDDWLILLLIIAHIF